MTDAPHFRFDAQTLAALRTSLRVWLLGLLRWLLDSFGPDIRIPHAVKVEIGLELASARAEVLDLIAMTAHRRLRPARRTSGGAFSSSFADPHRSRLCARRALTRGLLPRGRTLRERIAILLDAFRDIDTLAFRLIRRIAAGPKGAWAVVAEHDPDADPASATCFASDTS
jgi:hypothetical protein